MNILSKKINVIRKRKKMTSHMLSTGTYQDSFMSYNYNEPPIWKIFFTLPNMRTLWFQLSFFTHTANLLTRDYLSDAWKACALDSSCFSSKLLKIERNETTCILHLHNNCVSYTHWCRRSSVKVSLKNIAAKILAR